MTPPAAKPRARSSSGVLWAGASQGGRVVIQLVALSVLSRFLPPSDFGLLAMASVVTTFANLLRDMGTSAAVIQREKLEGSLLDTVFWFNVLLGSGLALSVLVLAFPVSVVFHEPRLQGVLVALAVSFPLASSGAVHQALMERSLKFRSLARIELSSSMLGLLIAVAAARAGMGVYSLVLNTLVMAAVGTLQLWISSPWRPARRWSGSEFHNLWEFSSNLVGFQVTNYFARNADSMLIGRFLGAADLGWYNMAYRVMLFPLYNLSLVVSRAMFPVLSRQQTDLASLATLYLRTISAIATITLPLMAGLWVLREPFVRIFLGERWLPVSEVLAWLAPVGMAQSVLTTVGLLYMATGSTKTMMRWGIFSSALMVGGMVIGLRWGYLGVARAYAATNLLLLYPNFSIPLKLAHLRFRDMLRAVSRQLAAAVIMAGVIRIADLYLLSGASAPIKLAVLIPLGTLAYAGVGWLIMGEALRDLLSIMRRKKGADLAGIHD